MVEDLRNTNFNFVLDVGDIPAGEYTLRVRPIYADVVEQSVTPFEFRAAGYLDGMANVPYLDIGNADEYQDEIAGIMSMGDAARHNAVNSTSFSFAGAFTGLGLDLARPHVYAIGRPVAEQGSDGVTLSTMGAGGWAIGGNLRGFADIHAANATHAETLNNIGYDTSTRSISAGVEYQVTPAVSFGVLLGGVDGTADANPGRGSIDASGWTLAAFGRAAFGGGGTVQGIVGWQDLSFDTTRYPVPGQIARGSTGGTQSFFALQADYMFRQGALSWGPMASVEHYTLSVDGFDESGSGAWDLSVGDQEGSVTLMSAGVRGEMGFGTDQATRAHGSIAMTRATGDDRLLSAGFIGLPQATLPVDGFEQDWVDVSLGVSRTIARAGGAETRIGAEYRGAFGQDYESHGVGVFVRMTF